MRAWVMVAVAAIALAVANTSPSPVTSTVAIASTSTSENVRLTEAEAATIRPIAAMRVEAALRTMGSTSEDVRAWRAATFGAAAAARLDEVDRRRADFSARLALLRSGRATARELFAADEIARVEALERLRGDAAR